MVETATIDHPIPMQSLSASVGAAAKKHAVPPKRQQCDTDAVSVLTGVSIGTCNVRVPVNVAKQCMIVEVELHGQQATILIDSGAQSSHISSNFIEKHHIPTIASPLCTTLVMANGHKQSVDRMVVDAELQLGGCKESVDMLVMPMTHYDAILGMSWHYAHYPVTYDLDTVEYMHENSARVLRRSDSAYQRIKADSFISAVALRRTLQVCRLRADGGVRAHEPCELYIVYTSPAVADIASTDGSERMNPSVDEEHYSDASVGRSEAALLVSSVDDNRNADASGVDVGSSTNEARSAVDGASGVQG